mmetsp:Transcript_59700/g.187231  ORF Transcript_59700/g.187231 Transcript_59700/m.187231 type:complete len:458 (-) Transcript_59700:606-1979(-)
MRARGVSIAMKKRRYCRPSAIGGVASSPSSASASDSKREIRRVQRRRSSPERGLPLRLKTLANQACGCCQFEGRRSPSPKDSWCPTSDAASIGTNNTRSPAFMGRGPSSRSKSEVPGAVVSTTLSASRWCTSTVGTVQKLWGSSSYCWIPWSKPPWRSSARRWRKRRKYSASSVVGKEPSASGKATSCSSTEEARQKCLREKEASSSRASQSSSGAPPCSRNCVMATEKSPEAALSSRSARTARKTSGRKRDQPVGPGAVASISAWAVVTASPTRPTSKSRLICATERRKSSESCGRWPSCTSTCSFALALAIALDRPVPCASTVRCSLCAKSYQSHRTVHLKSPVLVRANSCLNPIPSRWVMVVCMELIWPHVSSSPRVRSAPLSPAVDPAAAFFDVARRASTSSTPEGNSRYKAAMVSHRDWAAVRALAWTTVSPSSCEQLHVHVWLVPALAGPR